MSFTQEKRIKVRKCQGCEKHCEFGVKFEDSKVMHEGKLVSKQCVDPTLGGNAIKSSFILCSFIYKVYKM